MLKNKGFTLIELMVTVVIFVLIIGISIGVFVSAIRIQKYSLVSQQLLDQTSYAMEYMGRAIRMARKDDLGTCTGGTNYKVSTTEGEDHLIFKSYKDDYGCQEFFIDSGRLKTRNAKVEGFLTSGGFEVTSLKFNVEGDTSGEQPKVTIFMRVEGENITPIPKVVLQTTISQRNIYEY